MHPRRTLVALLAAVPAAALAACGDDGPSAGSENVVMTWQIGALTGTPLTTPSAFAVERGAVRTDQTSEFDIGFNILRDGRPVFLPLAALGLATQRSAEPGLQLTTMSFDEIDEAPSNGYLTRDTVAIAVGERYFFRSRITVCNIGVPLYAKVEVLALDPAARTVTFRSLANINCGLRGLAPGIPEE